MQGLGSEYMSAVTDILRWIEQAVPAAYRTYSCSAMGDAIRSAQPYLQMLQAVESPIFEQLRRESLILDAVKLTETSVFRQLLMKNRWDELQSLKIACFADILRASDEANKEDESPRITIKTLIIPGDKTQEGMLVNGVSALWFEMLRMIQNDPDSIHRIDCWKWEELLAGAYKQDGWEIVILTPRKGDKGIDVIAKRPAWGQLRFLLLDQMKAYSGTNLIGPDEIREMKGVLLDHPEANQAEISTTSNFTPGALEAAEQLFPRLELRPRNKLVAWLAAIATERLKSSGLAVNDSGD